MRVDDFCARDWLGSDSEDDAGLEWRLYGLDRLPDISADSEREAPTIGVGRTMTEPFDERLFACFRIVRTGLLPRSVGTFVIQHCWPRSAEEFIPGNQ